MSASCRAVTYLASSSPETLFLSTRVRVAPMSYSSSSAAHDRSARSRLLASGSVSSGQSEGGRQTSLLTNSADTLSYLSTAKCGSRSSWSMSARLSRTTSSSRVRSARSSSAPADRRSSE